MDDILVPHPAGGFIAAGVAFPAGAAVAAAAGANAAAAAGANAAAGVAGFADPALGVDADGFKTVRSKKYDMPRGANRGREEEIISEPDKVCDQEYEWYPKTGCNLKWVKKWAQVRKGRTIGTREGDALITYGCYAPASVGN